MTYALTYTMMVNILVMQACSKWLKVFNSRCRKSTILVERASVK